MKYLLFMTCMALAGCACAQEPIYTPMKGNYKFKGLKADTLLLIPNFTDTTTANATYLDAVPGAMIRCGNDFWMRNSNATSWLQNVNVGNGSSPAISFVKKVFRKAGKDSVFYIINPADTQFAFKDSIGAVGSDSATHVAYWSSSNTLTGNYQLIWNNTNGYLEIGSSPVRIGSSSGNRYIRGTSNNGIYLGVNTTNYGFFDTLGLIYNNKISLTEGTNFDSRIDLKKSNTLSITNQQGAEINFLPQVNGLDGSHIIRVNDYAYGNNSGIKGHLYLYAGKNTFDNGYGNIILQHDGTSSRGNVGIGVLSPSYKLDVNGSFNLTGNKGFLNGTDSLVLKSAGLDKFSKIRLDPFKIKVNTDTTNIYSTGEVNIHSKNTFVDGFFSAAFKYVDLVAYGANYTLIDEPFAHIYRLSYDPGSASSRSFELPAAATWPNTIFYVSRDSQDATGILNITSSSNIEDKSGGFSTTLSIAANEKYQWASDGTSWILIQFAN